MRPQTRLTHALHTGLPAAQVLRFVVARLMTGAVDEYTVTSPDGTRVIAWSHTVVKGDTLRG